MRIELLKDTHTYLVDGDIAAISVTELLQKHRLAPSYDGVNEATLSEARERGNLIHQDIEAFVNNANYAPQTPAGDQYASWLRKNAQSAVAEQPVAYKYGGMIVAGTCDIMGQLLTGERFVADHKATATIPTEYTRWEMSIYDYFARSFHGDEINGRPWRWGGAQKFFINHFGSDGKMKIKEVEPIPDEEIERLLAAEYHGEIYQRKELVIETDFAQAVVDAENRYAEIMAAKNDAEATVKEIRAKLLAEMKRQGVKSWDTGAYRITYVAQAERMDVDSRALKANYPHIYPHVCKITKVKEHLQIRKKEEDSEDEQIV